MKKVIKIDGTEKTFKKVLTFALRCDIMLKHELKNSDFGGLAQLARASGSYPAGRWFKSDIRYQNVEAYFGFDIL